MKTSTLSLARSALFLALAASMAAGTPGTLAAASPLVQFAHPQRIRYDSHCLTIDGKDVFIYSGAFHYFRCPKELWRDRFQKIKDAGFNAVETLAVWNCHERQMPAGLNDFSKIDLTDLDDWLKMAEEFGLYVIVRPGPYICGEWDNGGYPQWLMTKAPAKPLRYNAWLRSDDPVYLAWGEHWYSAVCPVIARHQVTHRKPGTGGVILMQLENEYIFAGFSASVMLNQLKALATVARGKGIDVPFSTCWTHPVRGLTQPPLSPIFDSCNFYPFWAVDGIKTQIDKLRHDQPNAPLMTTEVQGGWIAFVGGKPVEDKDGLTPAQINNLALFAIQNGDTILNYYMLFGGTNFGDRAGRTITTSYDYDAPIREWGGVGARYQRVWALGHMLREHGARLARAEAVACDVAVGQKDVTVVMRRAPDGSRYLFVRTSQHDKAREGTAHVKEKSLDGAEIVFDYKLEPLGSKVLYLPPGVNDAGQGQWLPKPAPEIKRPAQVPPGVVITTALRRNDIGPSHWQGVVAETSLAQAGIYDSGFVFYRAKVSSPTATNLMVEYPAGDDVLASIHGNSVARTRKDPGSCAFMLPSGSSDLELLYENLGHDGIGLGMEAPWGILGARLMAKPWERGKQIAGWRMHEVDSVRDRREVRPDFNDYDWTPVAVENLSASNLPAGHKAVYRAGLELTADDFTNGKLILNIGRVDDRGWVYANGESVGEATDWFRSYAFDISKRLHVGHNVIAVIVRNDTGPGGLGAPSLGNGSESTGVPLESLGRPEGMEKQWWKPDLNDERWQSVSLPDAGRTNQEHAGSILTWYRLKFELPVPKPGIWVPWHLNVNANGNGFLYLNGHPLGRYWQVGPQHDFFLPECWLKFGEDGTNVLTMSLRCGDKSTGILSATVEPYAEFAEER